MDHTQAQRKLRTLYCNLMDEIKHRTRWMQQVLDGTSKLADLPTFEFCYLQLRMICELIALGCLAVHDDIGATRKLKGKFQADVIIKAMEKLHPKFFLNRAFQSDTPMAAKSSFRSTLPT
jgi:hypothetical protein